MRSSRKACVGSVVVAALTAAGAAVALTPTRAIVSPSPVQDLALTRESVGYVADEPERLACGRIGYWSTKNWASFTVDAKELCSDETSTGQGIWDVSVATNRLLWLTYAGGNFREWFLWTATTTRREPRRLRFVSRLVESPPPIVLGPGTPAGIPYAVDRQIVYLGDNGRAIFKATVQSPVRAMAAGAAGIVALLANGRVVGFGSTGEELAAEPFPPGTVSAVGLSGLGFAVQVGREVRITKPRTHDPVAVVTLPGEATMVDIAQGRILWVRAGDLGTTTIATGKSTRLVDGTAARPASGQISRQGVAWSLGRTVRWRAGAPP